MSQLPCELMKWKVPPVIQKELACCIVHSFGLSQKEASEKLGLTPAAISLYKCNKQGAHRINDPTIMREIAISAERIIHEGETVVPLEIYRICKIIQSKGLQIII